MGNFPWLCWTTGFVSSLIASQAALRGFGAVARWPEVGSCSSWFKTWGVGGPKIWGWVNTYDITIFNMAGINIHSPAIGTYWHLGCQDLVNHINADLHGFWFMHRPSTVYVTCEFKQKLAKWPVWQEMMCRSGCESSFPSENRSTFLRVGKKYQKIP